MGYPEVGQVIYWLKSVGLRADRGFPGANMPRIEAPAAAVSLYEIDSALGRRTISVVVCSPVGAGGSACEDMAVRVMQVLTGQGADCIQNACSYNNWGHFFSVQVLASWQEIPEGDSWFTVSLGTNEMPFVTGITTRRETARTPIGSMGQREPGAILIEPGPWQITLTEQLPAGETEPEVPPDSFTLTVIRGETRESFTDCAWTEVLREVGHNGTRLVRTAVASDRRVI